MNSLLLMAYVVTAQANSALTPQRVLLPMSSDPARRAVATWRTDAVEDPSIGQIATAEPDPRFTTRSVTVAAKSTTITIPGTTPQTAHYHEVAFENLKPETMYVYRVGDGKNWSEWFQFKTASDKPKPFSFIYFGDAQNDLKSMWSRTIRQSYRDLPYADFMLHAGDLVDTPNRDSEWGEWFYAGGWIHATVPTIATPGNHEYARVQGQTDRVLSILWQPQFAYPANGLRQLNRTNYYIDFQGARIISLDSNRLQAEQAVWLERVLQNNPHKWTFVTFHHPVYSTARNRDNPEIRRLWGPLFQKYKVALVLQGHDHTYGRFNVPTGMTNVDRRSGTVYVVSVSGPKMYRLSDGAIKDAKRKAEFTQLYQIVRVNGDRLRFEAYTATGELYDAFEMRKTRDGGQEILDRVPRTKERTDPPAAPTQTKGGR